MRGRGEHDRGVTLNNQISIEELDESVDADAEQLWIEEAQRRYDAYLKGELEAREGDDVMNRARSRVAAKCL
jgi:hypothetical protein